MFYNYSFEVGEFWGSKSKSGKSFIFYFLWCSDKSLSTIPFTSGFLGGYFILKLEGVGFRVLKLGLAYNSAGFNSTMVWGFLSYFS